MSAFDDFWDRLCERTTHLSNECNSMTMTVAAFRKAMQRAYEAGQHEAASTIKFADDLKKIAEPQGQYRDFMKDLFGL